MAFPVHRVDKSAVSSRRPGSARSTHLSNIRSLQRPQWTVSDGSAAAVTRRAAMGSIHSCVWLCRGLCVSNFHWRPSSILGEGARFTKSGFTRVFSVLATSIPIRKSDRNKPRLRSEVGTGKGLVSKVSCMCKYVYRERCVSVQAYSLVVLYHLSPERTARTSGTPWFDDLNSREYLLRLSSMCVQCLVSVQQQNRYFT